MASNIRIAPLIRTIELLLFVALCALVARWATILFTGAALRVPPSADSLAAPPAGNLAAEMMKSARLFGSHPPGSLSENVRALGVIAPVPGNRAEKGAAAGSAIISVDGRPPRAYRVGSDVEGRRLVAIRTTEIEMEGNGVRQVFPLPPRSYASETMPFEGAPGARVPPSPVPQQPMFTTAPGMGAEGGGIGPMGPNPPGMPGVVPGAAYTGAPIPEAPAAGAPQSASPAVPSYSPVRRR